MTDHEAKRLVKIIRKGSESSGMMVVKGLGVEYQRIRKVKIEKPGYQWLPRT